MPHLFYNTDKLTKKTICELFTETKELSFSWWVDDKPSWTRRKIDMSFDDVLKLFKKTPRKKLHIVFIHRRGFNNEDDYIEVGFSTLCRKYTENDLIVGDVFLWINVDIRHKEYFLEKYFKIR